MQGDRTLDRRQFVGKVAGGVIATALVSDKTSASPAETGAGAPTTAGCDTIPIASDVFADYQKLLSKRVAGMKKRIGRAIAKPNARPVTLGVYQMRNHCDGASGKSRNCRHMIEAIDRAHSQGVQILVFPEMCLPGYFTGVNGTPEAGVTAAHAMADVVGESEYLERLRKAAARAEMVICFGFCEKVGADCYFNSAGVVDADGRWLGVRRKNPLYPYPYETRPFSEPPREQRAAVFQTRFGKVGVSICFDGEFPESVRKMRLEGAELLLWSNAALGDPVLGTTHRQNAAGFHAQANGFWVACCNCAAPNSSGMSSIYSPLGEPLVILPPAQEVIGIATVELNMTADWSVWKDRLVTNVESQVG